MLLSSVLALTVVTFAAAGTDRWASAAYRWLESESCSDCVQKDQMRLYVAEPTNLGKLRPIAADGSTRHAGFHDSILVIDPKPHLRLGHQIFMFFVDLNFTRAKCEEINGILLEGGDCLQQWKRTRCPRRMQARRGSPGCQLIYLPEVRLAIGGGGGPDRLVCRPSRGFSPTCPHLRAQTKPTTCDPLATNSKACDTTNYLKTQCNFMQTCDHAVLISGGWNRQLCDEDSIKNLQLVRETLVKNGFLGQNIKTFFANGLNKHEEVKYKDLGDVYPSGLKLALRFHLRAICETSRCADTLVIYLNSPTRTDGSALLWDLDSNGEYDETELYTVRELVRDLDKCRAHRVLILADQSYSAELARIVMRHADSLDNVILLGVGGQESRHSLIQLFVEQSPSTCLSTLVSRASYVKFAGASSDLLNTTLSGGPCSQDSSEGDFEKYFGCQNLSTLEMLEPDQVVNEEER